MCVVVWVRCFFCVPFVLEKKRGAFLGARFQVVFRVLGLARQIQVLSPGASASGSLVFGRAV